MIGPATIGSAMSDPAAAPPQAKRAEPLVRAVAFVIDLLLVHTLVAAIGLGATELSGGSVRVANAIDDVRACGASQPIPPELSVPRGFAGGDMRRCTRTVYGFAYDRMLIVRAAPRDSGVDADRRQISIPIDATGRPVHAFYLDSLTPLVLALYLLLFEWRWGVTLGKLVFGARVVTLAGGPIDVGQAAKRALIRALVVLCSAETQIGLGMTTAYGLPDLGVWSQVLNLLALAYLIVFAIATLCGLRPPHDWWAGTQVVRPVPAKS